jgi:hypothetical protein
MADENSTISAITITKDSAKEIISVAFDELAKNAKPGAGEQPRLFFPNGIELMLFTFEVSGVKVEFRVAGAAGIKALLQSDETGELVGEVVQEVR